MAAAVATPDTQTFINQLNEAYEKVHKSYEDNFWATKMALTGASTEELARTKTEYEAFLGDPANLKAVRERLAAGGLSGEQESVLRIMERTFKCYITEDPRAKELKERLNSLEAELAAARNTMALGYKDPVDGAFKPASSVQLRDTMRISDDEPTRKACYEGMRTIGPFVAERFIEIVKARNTMARLMGYQDFYDYKVTSAEGFGKTRLFEIMDDLEARTRPLMERARADLGAAKGADALQPWNTGWALAGDTDKALDPFFPFEDAVDVWARTFAALGITYRASTMNLDLCDRPGKYSNGFCHWPQCAWRKPDGTWVPAQTNFTSLATPSAVGSGKTALVTLLHEGGHAAHFANITQPSPFFSQERAPTSVAYAEKQSMLLDAFAGDAAWLGRYETPEAELSVEGVLALADRIENEVQGGLAGRPLMSVPHILADEASCYYHGYVLAEMSVHHTRAYFKRKLGGKLVDNPEVQACRNGGLPLW